MLYNIIKYNIQITEMARINQFHDHNNIFENTKLTIFVECYENFKEYIKNIHVIKLFE